MQRKRFDGGAICVKNVGREEDVKNMVLWRSGIYERCAGIF